MMCSVACGRLAAAGALLGLTIGAAQDANAAGAAYQVDTAEVSSVGSCKVESWVSSASNRDIIASVAPACVVDLSRPVEISAQFSRFRSDDEWGSTVLPKLKTNIMPSGIGQWGVALTATAAYDFTARDVTGFAFAAPATFRFSDVVRLNLNAGWQYDRPTDRHFFTYGAGIDWRTPDNVWTLTAEVFGLLGSSETQSEIEPRFQLGLRYRPVDQFNIDVIYGKNIAGENAHWLTIATVVRFSAAEK